MSGLLSCLSEYSSSVSSSGHGNTLDLSSLELSELSAADFGLLHQFLRNGATFDMAEDFNAAAAPHNGAMSAAGTLGGGHSSGAAGGVSPSSAALERVVLPSFTSSGRGGAVLYAFLQLLDVLDVASKSESLCALRAIDNFQSFANYFLMERLWTPSMLDTLADRCSKISKRLQRRHAPTLTFGIHGGGNIGLGLIAQLVTKPRRGLLRSVALAGTGQLSGSETAFSSGTSPSNAGAAMRATTTAPLRPVGQPVSDAVPVDLLSMSGAFGGPAGSALNTQSDAQGKGASGAEADAESGLQRDSGDAACHWRVIATTSKVFLRHLVRAGGRIRLRHQLSNSGAGGAPQFSYTEIPNVLLVDRSPSSVRELYVKSSVLAVCVTLNVFQQIRRDVAVGLLARFLHDEMPLTVLVCMNGTNAEQAVRDGVFAELTTLTGDAFARRVLRGINFVECVVDRIVRCVDDDDIAAQIIAQVTEKFGAASGSGAWAGSTVKKQDSASLTHSASGEALSQQFTPSSIASIRPSSTVSASRALTEDQYPDNGKSTFSGVPQQDSLSVSTSGRDSDADSLARASSVTENTADALFELCAAAASKERLKVMLNSATECSRLAMLLVLYGIRVAAFDAERVCSVYSRPFPEAHHLPHFSLTDDVRLYESVKNKFVNGSHYILSCMAGLSGYDLMAHAIQSPFLRSFVLELMEQEIAPVLIRACPSFAPPNTILERLKREFVVRCEENGADTVARVARDPLRKMNRGRRVRGTLELREKYKLSTPCYRLELGYCAALQYTLQSKDNDSGQTLRQVFQSAKAANNSYRAALTYSGPSSAGPFIGFHPDREAERVQRLLVMLVVLKQLANREKMAQLGLLLDLHSGHLFYPKAISNAQLALTSKQASATSSPAPPPPTPLALPMTAGRTPADSLHMGATSAAPAQPQPQVGTESTGSRASNALSLPPAWEEKESSNSTSGAAVAAASGRPLYRAEREMSASQTDGSGTVALLQQVQLQMRLQQLAAVSASAPVSAAAMASGSAGAAGSFSSGADVSSQADFGSSVSGSAVPQPASEKSARRALSVGSNLDALDFGGSGSEQSDDRDDSDAVLLNSFKQPTPAPSSDGEDDQAMLMSSDFADCAAGSGIAVPRCALAPIQAIEARSRWLQRRISYELLFVRHGETFGNAGQSTRDGRIDRAAVEGNVKDRSRRIFQGDVDTEINQLTGHGQQCAQQVAEAVISDFVRERNWMPDVVLHSPLRRAADTAKALTTLLPALNGVTVQDEGLREMKFGVAENARICDLLEGITVPVQSPQAQSGTSNSQFGTAAGSGAGAGVAVQFSADADSENQIWRRACHSFYEDQNAAYRFPEGESFCDVLWRVHAWLMRLESRFPNKRILVYGHSMWGAACAIIFGRGASNAAPSVLTPKAGSANTATADANSLASPPAVKSAGASSADFLAFDGAHVLPHTTPIPMNF